MIVIANAKLRRVIKIAVPFILIPAVIAAGALSPDGRQYAFISLAVAILSLILFAAGFEQKKTGSRRLIIIAVMVTLSVIGRIIPLFKPITALTILTAVYLGGEAGFLTGALSAVISNFYFGQGPWTPFQMLAWGLIGLCAGALSAPLKHSRLILVTFGALSGIAYSFIMDIWTVLWYNGAPNLALYISAIVTALPHTLLYSISNIVFLWAFAKPFGEKLERVKLKYGV